MSALERELEPTDAEVAAAAGVVEVCLDWRTNGRWTLRSEYAGAKELFAEGRVRGRVGALQEIAHALRRLADVMDTAAKRALAEGGGR